MHFALPPRKTSRPPPYVAVKSARSPSSRWLPWKQLAWAGTFLAILLLLLSWARRDHGSGDYIPSNAPSTVLVTTFDPIYSGGMYEKKIKHNRRSYVRKHGYAFFAPNTTDYDLTDPPCPSSWARIPALRHAMSLYPHSKYFFFLDQHALIMNQDLSIEQHVMKPSRLSKLMLLNRPVVPPDSIIHTYSHIKPQDIDLVLTQDHESLSQNSFVLRSGEWARFFLDAWFDPLYRSYNFQRAEGHALEHLVQWHGTVLVKLAIIPQKIINAYVNGGDKSDVYADGDFVASFANCDRVMGRECEEEVLPMAQELGLPDDSDEES